MIYGKLKAAGGAPTRGGFLMASDVPSFRAPRLDVAIQKNSGDAMPGGLADKQDKHFSDFPKKSLTRGEKVEHEHTKSHHTARSIAMDHLTEDPKYYGKLQKMEKDNDFLPGSMTYNSGDFKRSKYAMSLQEIDGLVERLLKQGEAGITPAGQLAKTQSVGAPKVTAAPGPSIADIAKPKGAKFGIGIPGAFKTKI